MTNQELQQAIDSLIGYMQYSGCMDDRLDVLLCTLIEAQVGRALFERNDNKASSYQVHNNTNSIGYSSWPYPNKG